MPAINHVHTYVRHKAKPGYYKCDAPDCSHFIDRESIVNKLSLCTECGSQMKLTREDLKRARPKCLNCSQTKKAKAQREAQREALGNWEKLVTRTDNFTQTIIPTSASLFDEPEEEIEDSET